MTMSHRFVFGLLLISITATASEPRRLSAVNGAIKFVATTNVLSLTVEGQSNKMSADVTLVGTDAALNLIGVNAKADPKTLTTGMSLRDRHMHEKVFALDDGTIPELRFTAGNSTCPKPQSTQQTACSVSGQLTLRGVTRPMTVDLKIRREGSAYRIDGQSAVTLSSFGIDSPCQLGVCVKDEVKLNFAFQARESSIHGGGSR